MPVTLTMAELATAENVDLGASEWMAVTQDVIDRFADATDDHQWIHVDPEKAAEGPFGRTIAHGYLTMAFLPSMLGSLIDVPDARMRVNYGLDTVRLTAPVPVDARIRAKATLRNTEQKAGGTLYRVDTEVEIEGEDRPALVGTILGLAYA